MPDRPPALDDTPFVDALLSVLLPASSERGLPAAGELGIAQAVAASARADALLAEAVEAGLNALRDAALAEDPAGLQGMTHAAATDLVRDRLAANPVLMLGLLRHTYPAYYQHPRVLQAIGEPPRPPFPEGFSVEPTDPALMAALETRRRKP